MIRVNKVFKIHSQLHLTKDLLQETGELLDLAKLDDGLAESPTVMVGETKTKQKRKNPVGLLLRPKVVLGF